jgi:hypothetical protein
MRINLTALALLAVVLFHFASRTYRHSPMAANMQQVEQKREDQYDDDEEEEEDDEYDEEQGGDGDGDDDVGLILADEIGTCVESIQRVHQHLFISRYTQYNTIHNTTLQRVY